MNAGRELDALIDERVFGYEWWPVGQGDHAPATCTHLLCGPSRRAVPMVSFHIRAERHADGRVVASGGRRYSTDIDAALDVLGELGGIVTITRMTPDAWHVVIGNATWWAETLPLAICRAALAAVEVPA